MNTSVKLIAVYGSNISQEFNFNPSDLSAASFTNIHRSAAFSEMPPWLWPTASYMSSNRGELRARMYPIPILFNMLGVYSRRQGNITWFMSGIAARMVMTLIVHTAESDKTQTPKFNRRKLDAMWFTCIAATLVICGIHNASIIISHNITNAHQRNDCFLDATHRFGGNLPGNKVRAVYILYVVVVVCLFAHHGKQTTTTTKIKYITSRGNSICGVRSYVLMFSYILSLFLFIHVASTYTCVNHKDPTDGR